ncbi:hypothetical protein ABT297_12350 [Dactylosporangium sp. NPDC000555]|uniref:hypothetical protein n=1 Tax=Dactylosporangium sp. NPDC000555 TaxID=3154260 RepID=UPI003316DF3B
MAGQNRPGHLAGPPARPAATRAAWALIAALPLTPPAGFLTFWYLPPGLALGTLLAWAIAGVTIGRSTTRLLDETSAMRPAV